jgi:ubiquinone/menaquinone biosynthesis C-methylase UbiE
VAEISLEVRTSLAEFSFEDRFASLPLGLVLKVNGSTDPNAFREIGNSAAAIIQEQAEGLLAHGTPAVLDFGCGLGRVLFALQRRFAHCRFTGFDIDPAMLRWGRWLHSGLPCEFTSTTNGYADQAFDFIYAISVFTHLDKQTDYWLGEIARLLTPRGRALLTFHDDTLFSEDHPALGPLKESYVCGADTPEGGAGMGTFYTRAYWEKKLQAFFNVETTRVRGMFGHQSFSVASKKPGSAPAPQAVRGYLKALEEEVALYRLGKLGE